jgi:hypothetical protein
MPPIRNPSYDRQSLAYPFNKEFHLLLTDVQVLANGDGLASMISHCRLHQMPHRLRRIVASRCSRARLLGELQCSNSLQVLEPP